MISAIVRAPILAQPQVPQGFSWVNTSPWDHRHCLNCVDLPGRVQQQQHQLPKAPSAHQPEWPYSTVRETLLSSPACQDKGKEMLSACTQVSHDQSEFWSYADIGSLEELRRLYEEACALWGMCLGAIVRVTVQSPMWNALLNILYLFSGFQEHWTQSILLHWAGKIFLPGRNGHYLFHFMQLQRLQEKERALEEC